MSDEALNEGWIEWEGGDCPVPLHTRVNVRFRDGDRSFEKQTVLAGGFFWRHDGDSADIVAYKIASQTSQEYAMLPNAANGGLMVNMTKRECYAAQALSAFGSITGKSAEQIAKRCFAIADHMIAESKKGGAS